MPSKSFRLLLPALALIAGIAAAACGSVATPEWAAEAQATQAAMLATSDHLTAIAPTATFTSTPTDTPVPPTATPTDTPVPPTATPAPTDTPVPPTPAPTQEAAAGGDLAARVAAADPANGQVIFNTTHTTATGAWMCSQCHSVTPDDARIIGPGLWNVSTRSQTYGLNETPEEYIHNSIVDPSAFLAPGDPPYPDNLMPHDFLDLLGEKQIDDLIAYLMTLHD